MNRFTRLLIAATLSVGALAATTIEFPTSLVTFDQLPFTSATAGGITVDFFILPYGTTCPTGCSPTLRPYGAVSGSPETGFTPNDLRDGQTALSPPDGFLTDEVDGPTPEGIYDYLMRFDSGVPGAGIPDISLHLLDFRVDGGPEIGDRVWLEAYSTNDWNDTPGFAFDFYDVDGTEPDGNIVTLSVKNPGFSILSARVRFAEWDTGTGIDNLSWTTVPEPGTVAMFGTGLLALGALARRRFRTPRKTDS